MIINGTELKGILIKIYINNHCRYFKPFINRSSRGEATRKQIVISHVNWAFNGPVIDGSVVDHSIRSLGALLKGTFQLCEATGGFTSPSHTMIDHAKKWQAN